MIGNGCNFKKLDPQFGGPPPPKKIGAEKHAFLARFRQWRRQLLEFTRSWQGPENICQVLSTGVGDGGQLASPPKKIGKNIFQAKIV